MKKFIFGLNGNEDDNYLNELGLSNEVEIIPPNLSDYDKLLTNEDIDFVGTRLHGGIRAIQKKHRAVIISIDNRAEEIAKDYNINILKRSNINLLESYVNSEIETQIILPEENINKWKNQFKNIKYS